MVNDEIDNAKTNRMYKQKLTNQVREYAQHGIWNFKKKECIHQMEQISPIHASKQRVKKKASQHPASHSAELCIIETKPKIHTKNVRDITLKPMRKDQVFWKNKNKKTKTKKNETNQIKKATCKILSISYHFPFVSS